MQETETKEQLQVKNHYIVTVTDNSKKNDEDHRIFELLSAYHQYQQSSYQSIIEFYQLSMCDAILRIDWHSTSPYLRSRKITYGTMSLMTSIRQLIWNVYHFNGHLSNMKIGNETIDFSNAFKDGLYVLFNSLIPIVHTYFALNPSRIRLWQWNIGM